MIEGVEGPLATGSQWRKGREFLDRINRIYRMVGRKDEGQRGGEL
jgi:hypothetical protein